MTQNEKDLLLQDICSRLPYGVKGLVTFNRNLFMTQIQVEDRTIDGKLYDRFAEFQDSWYDNVTIKPYLFPHSSMTEEQKSQYSYFLTRIIDGYDASLLIDWYNKNHFDYRGLIGKGLAIDATELNIY